jgi:hypothetical protein
MGEFMRTMLKITILGIIISLFLISCDTAKPNDPKRMDIFLVNISQDTDWNYMIVGKDGSSIFFRVDEDTNMPTDLYIKPDINSDDGLTFIFKENGWLDKVVVNGHVLYFGNFSGYQFDLAVIYPDNRIEYFFEIETDIDWDAYNDLIDYGRFINFNRVLNIISH